MTQIRVLSVHKTVTYIRAASYAVGLRHVNRICNLPMYVNGLPSYAVQFVSSICQLIHGLHSNIIDFVNYLRMEQTVCLPYSYVIDCETFLYTRYPNWRLFRPSRVACRTISCSMQWQWRANPAAFTCPLRVAPWLRSCWPWATTTLITL